MSKYRIKLNGNVYEIEVECIDNEQVDKTEISPVKKSVKANKTSSKSSNVVQIIDSSVSRSTKLSDSTVCSVMPGTVVRILYSEGSFVKKGQPVLVLEAMKMENEVVAPKNGTILKMSVSEGQTVAGGALLFEIE